MVHFPKMPAWYNNTRYLFIIKVTKDIWISYQPWTLKQPRQTTTSTILQKLSDSFHGWKFQRLPDISALTKAFYHDISMALKSPLKKGLTTYFPQSVKWGKRWLPSKNKSRQVTAFKWGSDQLSWEGCYPSKRIPLQRILQKRERTFLIFKIG